MQTFNIEKTDSQWEVTWRYFSLDVIVSLAFFAFWTGMLGLMTCMVLVHQRFEFLLFLLPFWAVVFGLFAWVANILFGKTRFVLDKDGLETEWTCLSIRRERRFDLADIRRFETKVRHGNKGRRTYSLQIVLRLDNANFSAPTGESTFDDLCKQLNDFLHTLKTGDAPDAAGEPEGEGNLREFYEDGKFWQVAFRDKSEADIAVIDGLYNAEALWLADVVLREQRTIR
ncbi:MAG: hypothetical protein FWE95_01475 [Planctomycetaceae bacterium]|nr:hypothetical protein [Planctomycetaceae bacterium]